MLDKNNKQKWCCELEKKYIYDDNWAECCMNQYENENSVPNRLQVKSPQSPNAFSQLKSKSIRKDKLKYQWFEAGYT